jgi:hypothetical protein
MFFFWGGGGIVFWAIMHIADKLSTWACLLACYKPVVIYWACCPPAVYWACCPPAVSLGLLSSGASWLHRPFIYQLSTWAYYHQLTVISHLSVWICFLVMLGVC